MSVASPLPPAVVAEAPSFADASSSASSPAAAAAAAPAESASSPAPESAALAPTKSKEEFRNYEDSFRHEVCVEHTRCAHRGKVQLRACGAV